jgi:hypothetical protein
LCEKNGETVTHSGDEFWRGILWIRK